MQSPSTAVFAVASILLATLAGNSLRAQIGGKAQPAAGKQEGKIATPTQEAGAKKAPIAPIWVVDMAKAAVHTKAYEAGLSQSSAMGKAFEAKLNAMKTRIDSLDLEMKTMEPSPERMEVKLEIETLIGRRQLAAKMYQARIDQERVKNDNAVFAELQGAVGELAKRRGILLVLRKHPHLTVREMLQQNIVKDEETAQKAILRGNQKRHVVYHSADLDLTEDLIKYLKK